MFAKDKQKRLHITHSLSCTYGQILVRSLLH